MVGQMYTWLTNRSKEKVMVGQMYIWLTDGPMDKLIE